MDKKVRHLSLTFPPFLKSHYIYIQTGKNMRKERKDVENDTRRESNFLRFLVFFGFLSVAAVSLTVVTGASLYIVKSSLGIDLFQGHPLTDTMKNLGLCGWTERKLP